MKNGKTYLLLHILFALYSSAEIFSKLASGENFMSIRFCLLYCCMIAVLGIYAIGWQQVIKHIPLSTAFANKAVTVIWGTVLGSVFFHESVTPGKIAGIGLIVVGIIVFSLSDEEETSK